MAVEEDRQHPQVSKFKDAIVISELTVTDMFSRAHAAFAVSTGLATEAAIRLALCAAFYITDVPLEPFVRVIHREEAWLYANPLTQSYFPTSYLWATVAFGPPVAVAVVHAFFVTGWRSRRRECATDVVAAVLVMTLLVGALHHEMIHIHLQPQPLNRSLARVQIFQILSPEIVYKSNLYRF